MSFRFCLLIKTHSAKNISEGSGFENWPNWLIQGSTRSGINLQSQRLWILVQSFHLNCKLDIAVEIIFPADVNTTNKFEKKLNNYGPLIRNPQ